MKQAASYSFGLNISVMKILGLYPTENLYSFHRVYAFVLYTSAMIPTSIFGILHFVFIQDLTLDYNDFILVAMFFYTFKFLPFIIRRDRIKQCIHYFDDTYFAVDGEQQHIIYECIHICRRNSTLFFVSCIIGIIGFVGQLILRNNYELPLNVWLPEYIKKQPIFYSLVYVLLAFGPAYSALSCSIIDPLIGGLINHATAQVQVLKMRLQHLDSYFNKKVLQLKSNDKLTYGAIKKCVQRYQAISEFVKEFETCFSPVVFAQFIGSGVVIALCCFQLSKMLTVDINFFIMIDYLSVLFVQIFFYCYYGTILIEESGTLSTAIYMSQWYKYDLRSKKSLIILMNRSQKLFIVKAGYLFDLSLETFSKILRRAYSLLAVLNNY